MRVLGAGIRGRRERGERDCDWRRVLELGAIAGSWAPHAVSLDGQPGVPSATQIHESGGGRARVRAAGISGRRGSRGERERRRTALAEACAC